MCGATTVKSVAQHKKIRFARDHSSVLDDGLQFRIGTNIFHVKCIRIDKYGLFVRPEDIIRSEVAKQIVTIVDSHGSVHHVPVG